jgi:hypothetical protein
MPPQESPFQESPFDAAVSDLVVANRILAVEGVLDGFGHVSVRDPRDSRCYLMSRSLAPALVTAGANLDPEAVEMKCPITRHGIVRRKRRQVGLQAKKPRRSGG